MFNLPFSFKSKHSGETFDSASGFLDRIGATLDHSMAFVVFSLVMVWVTSAVLMTLSHSRQWDLTLLREGSQAPFTVYSRIDFSYTDRRETERLRRSAAAKVGEHYRVSAERSEMIKNGFENLSTALLLCKNRADAAKFYPPGKSRLADLISGITDFTRLRSVLENPNISENIRKELDRFVRHGIAGDKKIRADKNTPPVRIITADDRITDLQPAAVSDVADRLTEIIAIGGAGAVEFRNAVLKILADGNLDFAGEETAKARRAAAAKVAEIKKECFANDILIEKNKIITADVIERLKAERSALTSDFGLGAFRIRLVTSFLILGVLLFFTSKIYPEVFFSARLISLCSALFIISMLANYLSLELFFKLLAQGWITDYPLVLCFMPIPLAAALFSVLIGNRPAIFGVFLVSSITAMLVFPDKSFELALRWFMIGMMMSMCVRNVTNYRSFFFRVLLIGALCTALLNIDILYNLNRETLKAAAIIIIANGAVSAIAGLLLIFGFELFLNILTNMSLTAMCTNHPLLEKLKREAPGTMFHSMNVATLAEDAAVAIRCNPQKARAGALFHDIGKLSAPQKFVENNPDSPKEYEKLPPEQSSRIIRDHVTHGLTLAHERRLPRFIREAITSHHGDDLVSFFYRKAVDEQKADPTLPPVDEQDFHYDGTPPDSKELTIISLADACEAASRSLSRPSPEEIAARVNDIFIAKMNSGQLRRSELTMQELNTIKECFIRDLINSNHGRIEYYRNRSARPKDNYLK